MAEAARVHVDVALELRGDTIRGTVDDSAGPVVEFEGWLELMSALDTVCARAGGGPSAARGGGADAG